MVSSSTSAPRLIPATPRYNSRAVPMSRHRRARLTKLAGIMDDRFRLPGTNLRFGIDGLVGLIPGVGDTTTAAVGSYIIAEAWRADIPKRRLARMLANLGIDWVAGLVPLVGDLFDFGFKSHKRNVDLLLKSTHPVD